MNKTPAGHRVIGIRYALKHLKKAGLVENNALYPEQAVVNVQSEILSVAQTWYEVGAKRGALEVLEAFLNGDFEVSTHRSGERRIIADTKAITWKKSLTINVGNKKQQVPKQTYKLTLEELGFDV